MRLYHNKPRRPKPKAAETTPRQKQRAQLANASGAMVGLLILMAWVRMSIAVAGSGGAALVGDRVQFGAPSLAFPDHIIAAQTVANPFSAPGAACRLDVNEMSNTGGVLTVLAVRADGVMLSWAGGATSIESDCHRLDKPVLVSSSDYESLAKAQFPKH